MKTLSRTIIALLFLITLAVLAWAELRLERPHGIEEGTEDPDYTYNVRFSLDNALRRLEQIRASLNDFRDLTESLKQSGPREELPGVANTGWETQNMGFPNWLGAIEGTLRKQEDQIRKLELDLAAYRFEQGFLPEKDLLAAKEAHRKAEAQFQAFWDAFHVVD